VLGSGEQELSPSLEEIERLRQLGLRDTQGLCGILTARLTPTGALEVQRDRGQRRCEIVKERAQKLPSGRIGAIVRIVH
jgi:hypothetical protein